MIIDHDRGLLHCGILKDILNNILNCFIIADIPCKA